MAWYSHLFKSFPPFVMIHRVKDFSVIDGTEVDVFLKFLCFLYNPTNVGNLISGSSSFSKLSLDIWKFLVHVMLKPGIQAFKHFSMGDECNCLIVSIFIGITLLGNWNEDCSFPVLWTLLGLLRFADIINTKPFYLLVFNAILWIFFPEH